MTNLLSTHALMRLMAPSADWLLHSMLGVTALLAAAWLVTRICERRSPELRHSIWLAAITASLALPWIQLPLAAPFAPDVLSLGSGVGLNAGPGTEALSWVAGPTTESDFRPFAMASTAARLALMVWAAGSLLFAARLSNAWRAATRMISGSAPVADAAWLSDHEAICASYGLGRVPLLASASAVTPFVFGLRRPAVVIPAALLEVGYGDRRSILLHELTHVRRRDTVGRLIAAIAKIALWPVPLVRLAAHRLDLESERACDQAVLEGGVAVRAYVRQLTSMATVLAAKPTDAWVTAALGDTDLFVRIQTLCRQGPIRRVSAWTRSMAWVVTATLMVLLSRMDAPQSSINFFFAERDPGAAQGPEFRSDSLAFDGELSTGAPR